MTTLTIKPPKAMPRFLRRIIIGAIAVYGSIPFVHPTWVVRAAPLQVRVGLYDLDPLVCTHRQGKPDGLFVKLMDYIAEKEGWQLAYQPLTLSNGRTRLEEGTIDILLAVPPGGETGKPPPSLSAEAVFVTWAQVFARHEDGIESIFDLQGKTVGIVQADPHGKALRHIARQFDLRFRFVEFEGYDKVMTAIDQHWIDAGVVDQLFGLSNPVPGGLRRTPVILSPVEMRVGLSHDAAPRLAEVINYHLLELKINPGSPYHRWLEVINRTPRERLVIGRLAGGLGLALIVLAAVSVGALLLRRQVCVKNRQLRSELDHRTQIERSLEISERRYRQIFEHIGTALLLIDRRGIITMVNGMARRLGLQADHPVKESHHWREFISRETRREILAALPVTGADGSPSHSTRIEASLNTRLGPRDIWIQVSDVPGGEHSVVSLIDVTERNRNEKERKRLASAIDQTSDAVLITDTAMNIQYANPAFETLTGFGPGTEGACLRECLAPAAGMPGQEERPVFNHKRWSGRVAIHRKDTTTIQTLITVSPIRNPKEEIVHYVTIIRDVTQEALLERQLMQAQKSEALGRLAGGIAHDFNNVLTAIMGNIELARMDTDDVAGNAERMDAAQKAGDRARLLIRQILTFSRGEAVTQKREVSLCDIVQEVVNLMGSAIPSGIEIVTALTAQSSRVFADPTQLHQVVMNLCTNGIQAMLPGEGRLTLQVSAPSVVEADRSSGTPAAIAPDDRVCLVVEDTGRGMDGQTRERIFEPFFTTKECGEGTGMGLAVVHGIVRAHGGTIQVDSALGRGTTFRIYLPRSSAHSQAPAAIPLPLPVSNRRHARILLVDDDDEIVTVGRHMLEKMNYSVESADGVHGAAALLAASPRRFDLILTDYNMPHGDGVTLARQASRISPQTPVVLMSGYSDEVQPEAFRKFGFVAFLSKPFLFTELGACVRRILEGGGAAGDSRHSEAEARLAS